MKLDLPDATSNYKARRENLTESAHHECEFETGRPSVAREDPLADQTTAVHAHQPAAYAARPVRPSARPSSEASSRGPRDLLASRTPSYNMMLTRHLLYRVNKDIVVRLKWGETEYKGRLVSTDSYMNIQLTNAQEFIDQKFTSDLGQILIRCNNVLWIKAADGEGDVKMEG